MARDEIGVVGGIAALIGVVVIMVIMLAVLASSWSTRLAESPWGVFSISMTIPIALLMGFYLRYAARARSGGVGHRGSCC